MSGLQDELECTIFPRHATRDAGDVQAIPCGDSPTTSNATIKLIREGERVKAIDVRCGCGVVTRIECNYE
jgi:hypothetical protein